MSPADIDCPNGYFNPVSSEDDPQDLSVVARCRAHVVGPLRDDVTRRQPPPESRRGRESSPGRDRQPAAQRVACR